MTSTRRSAVLLVSLWTLVVSCPVQAGWVMVLADADTDEVAVYNDERVTDLGNERVSVWLLYIGGKDKKIAARNKMGLSVNGYEAYASSAHKMIYDCGKKKMAVASIYDYADNRNILEAINIPPAELEFADAVAGSVGEKVMIAVCKNGKP